MRVKIRENEAGFVFKNGIFVKMLLCGTYRFSRLTGYDVRVEEMRFEVDMEFLDVPYQVLAGDKEFCRRTVRVEVPDGTLGFVYIDGRLNSLIEQGEYVFWNVFEKHEVRFVSMETDEITAEVTKQMLAMVPQEYYKSVAVGEGETALLYYDNVLQRQLTKGIYRFWNYSKEVSARVFNMKQTSMDIVGQEILTRDKIGIRMNVTCMYKIRDAIAFVETVSDLKSQLYTCVQLVIREMTGNYKLDEILERKDKISQEIFEKLKEQETLFCVEFLSAGIKDIILPGEIQNIMNTVLVAEKTAQANVIARREEVASTRSLLNTAKLMDENKTLYRLKELEYLERICERVGEISVNGNGGMVE